MMLPFFADSKDSVKLHTQAIIAIYSSILMWVGAWDLLTEGMVERNHGPSTWSLLPKSSEREAIYLGGGVILCIFCDSFYGNAGLVGTFFPDWWFNSKYQWLSMFLHVIRCLLATLGCFTMWVGLYDIFDYYVTDNLYRDLAVLLGGVFALFLSGTIFNMAYVYPITTNADVYPPDNDADHDDDDDSMIRVYDDDDDDNDDEEDNGFSYWYQEIDSSSPCYKHSLEIIRSCVSLVAQNMIWNGAYDLLENYQDSTLYRELFYATAGLMMMSMTRTILTNSWIETEATEGPDRNISVLQFARALIALVGQVIHNTGIWVILDLYLFKSGLFRNIIYLCVGAIGLIVSRAYHVNFGVAYREYPDTTPDKLDIQSLSVGFGIQASDTISDEQENKPILPLFAA